MWHKIPGIDPEYEINRLGEVRSCKRGGWKILKAKKMKIGYRMFSLRAGGRVRDVTRHRIMAQTFIPNPNGLPEVNHIDGNKSNDSLENLEWVSHRDNIRHAARIGLMPRGDALPQTVISDEKVAQIRAAAATQTEKLGDIASRFGVRESEVSDLIRGGRSGFPSMFPGRYHSTAPRARGFKCHNAKLTKEMAEEARRRKCAGEYIQDIAKEMGVYRRTLSRAIKRVGGAHCQLFW